jgi:hypothetical protein
MAARFYAPIPHRGLLLASFERGCLVVQSASLSKRLVATERERAEVIRKVLTRANGTVPAEVVEQKESSQ